MQATTTTSFKQHFLKHFLLGLHANRDSTRERSLDEREKEVKVLADEAMALARGNGAKWSRSLIEGMANKQENNEAFIGKKLCKEFKRKNIMKKKKKCFNSRLKVSRKVVPSVMARRIVRKRTQVLKSIIPGAESLDGISLLSETLDYVVHLKAQANIMQQLTRVFGV